MSTPTAPPGEAGLAFSSARGRWVLAATVLGSGIAFLDSTVVNVALPHIGEDLDTGVGGLQWVLNGYLLAVSALILLGGSLGDRFGRKRIFQLGIVVFAVGSLLCAVAPTAVFLVLARVVQGVGGALLTPGSLAILEASFRPEGSFRGPSARGRGSAARRRRSARSSAAGWSTPPRGGGSSSSTCRWPPSSWWWRRGTCPSRSTPRPTSTDRRRRRRADRASRSGA